MIKVKFNSVAEFCQELKKDAGKVERGILRTTKQTQMSSMSPNIHYVFALASYSIEGQIVELRKFCGEIWHIREDEDKKSWDKAEAVLKEIEDLVQGIAGVEIRAGHLEDDDTKK
jgi:phage host-nuclease inhibitor protein Gam